MKHADDKYRRRGAALLIVLGTLILTVTATTILVSAAATAQLRRDMARMTLVADDLLESCEAPIQDWLFNQSAKVVLAPESTSPRLEILDDAWQANEFRCELRITAFDQFGMVPMELVQKGSPLRLALPTDLLQRVDSARVAPAAKPGLDIYIDTESAAETPLLSPFPNGNNGSPKQVNFGETQIADNETGSKNENSGGAIGELVATHNADPFRLNINTAPMELVRAVLDASGRGGLEEIIANRRAGKLAVAGGQISADSTKTLLIPQLVSTSSSWSFRIDVHVSRGSSPAGGVRKSWWAVYQPAQSRSPRAASQNYKWECVQRLVIPY